MARANFARTPGPGRRALIGALATILLGAGLSGSVSAQSTPEASPTALGCWTADQVTEDPTLGKQYAQPPAMKIDPAKTYTATIETNKGTITPLSPAIGPVPRACVTANGCVLLPC